MKSHKYYRILYLYDCFKDGKIVTISNFAGLFEVDQRTIQRDINDVRCYLANIKAVHGCKNGEIVYDRSKGGYTFRRDT